MNKILVASTKIHEKEVFPLTVVDEEKLEHFDLILLNQYNEKYHCTFIKYFSRLIHS